MFKFKVFHKVSLGLLLVGNVLAEDVIIHSEALDLTLSKVIQEVQSQPDDIREKLKTTEPMLKKFVDAVYNESLFEIEANKQQLQNNPEVQSKIAAATRKVLVEELIDRKQKSIKVPDMEPLALTEYQAHPENYVVTESVHARHILVPFDDVNKAEKKQFLEGLAKRIAKGEDFAVLARQYSTDKGSAAKGGDLGVFGKGQMVPEFEQAVFALKKPKQLSPIVETKFGFHLIQLLEHMPAKQQEFSEVKAQLIAGLEQEYVKNEMKSWRTAIIDPSKAKLNEVELQKLINDVKKLP